MAAKNFSVFTTPITQALALGDYHPYRLQGERNPAFDTHSGCCLSLKDPQNRQHAKAVRYFTDALGYDPKFSAERRSRRKGPSTRSWSSRSLMRYMSPGYQKL